MADLVLSPVTTTVGLIELVLLHEVQTPSFPDYNAKLAFRAMRLMRQVLRNRLKHPGPFGAAGAKDEAALIKVRSQFGEFADAPDLPFAFMHNVYATMAAANNLKHPRY